MIKTRFAPSPTGYLHLGGLRTALYDYLLARKSFDSAQGGIFALRIEDTDQNRYVAGAVEQLLSTLKKLGLEADEGPVLDNESKVIEKGQFGPYFQSQRLELYRKYAEQLIDSNQAYYCFCSEERLEQMRKDQEGRGLPPKYDRHCLNLNKEEVAKKLQDQTGYVIRFKMPNGQTKFVDLIRGEIIFDNELSDDPVILKSDSFPTYHLAMAVDDHLMEVTHVIRGEEWLSSVPKHIALYQALGWEVPQFAHLSLILNPDKTKLSKRQGDVAVEDYLVKGYLPQAILNYVAFLGWNPKTEQEIFTLDELVQAFEISGINKAGAIFDRQKLDWYQKEYLYGNEAVFEAWLGEYGAAENFNGLARLEVAQTIWQDKRILNYPELTDFLKSLTICPDYEKELLIFKKSNLEKSLSALQLSLDCLTKQASWDRSSLFESLKQLASDNGLTNGDLFWPVRVSLSGQGSSPAPQDLLAILGQKESVCRLVAAVKKLS
ncbi:MAG: glutamate--tRNA ligase [Candidatus Komeilibacteria bacterium]|nr:glutamate--tRNA ligase [Candidatus Komeilibacteria bacterium]